jgi:outer membrane protein OmpA-like peptidoglycan-associated protein
MEGANQCFPASVHLAKLRENRIAREIAGELFEDAENNLIIQRLDLNRIEQKLEAVVTETSCWASDSLDKPEEMKVDSIDKPVDTAELRSTDILHLFKLLNSDNQFALNSDQINPKYALNLIRACSLLDNEPDIKLNVVGHSDASGKTDYNATLSSRRTMAVVEFLSDCNIDIARINSSFEGDSAPLYDGRSPAVDLVNRRVSIELIMGNDRNL